MHSSVSTESVEPAPVRADEAGNPFASYADGYMLPAESSSFDAYLPPGTYVYVARIGARSRRGVLNVVR